MLLKIVGYLLAYLVLALILGILVGKWLKKADQSKNDDGNAP